MSLGLYMDEQVEYAITRGLQRRGVDALTAQEDGRSGEDDPVLLDRAAELGRLLFTRDEDFLVEAARRQRTHEPSIAIIYAHQKRMTVAECIQELELIAQASDLAEYASRVLYLPYFR